MKRIKTQNCYTQIMLLPTFGFVRRDYGGYDYKYRIAFCYTGALEQEKRSLQAA